MDEQNEQEKHKKLVQTMAQAFRDLPSDRARLDIVVAMVTVLRDKAAKGKDDLLTEWMEQATGTLKAALMLWR
jgi:hypothetical protein